ncbi:hypothetical protein GO730_00520 [Spirosoma sp. HMF3257]|uniref:hypothetical protein n=1 Tax=Spirosoma telluris TaxID=2183553 RepID=UPI0012FB7F11|nr:hypothetical protein [Spirosoma telluris]
MFTYQIHFTEGLVRATALVQAACEFTALQSFYREFPGYQVAAISITLNLPL